MKLIYSFGVWLYSAAVHVASLWNAKAKKWVSGRRESFAVLENFSEGKSKKGKDKRALETLDSQTKSLILNPLSSTYWFHCASLGEFEQGRPLMEALKAQENCQIAVSFFSPSGFEIRKNYELADVVFYLPVDSKKNAQKVFELLQPKAVFFIKYEFWANYILESQKRKIPFYSVAAVFRKNQIFFRWYGSYMRQILKACTQIFVQHNSSQKLLKEIGIESIVSGDTRYDRVMKNAEKARRFELIDVFVNSKKVFVCGSLWRPDLEAVSEGLKNLGNEWKIILTTHEIDETHLTEAESFFSGKKIVRYSKLSAQNSDAEILLIDNVGMLMHVYGYANMAYVGGAFKTGLHNILEPASFGLPVIFGPHHKKFPEAPLFIDNGIGFSISSAAEFKLVLENLQTKNLKDEVLNFMNSQRGATDLILKTVLKQLANQP
jgi:3-deoxy-D-manno-octulosonic-acid transferase